MSGADDLDIYKIDFEWIKKTDSSKQLNKALRILKEDGEHYPDLQREIEKKLSELDPKFKKLVPQPVDPVTKEKAISELKEWTEDVNQREKNKTSKEIFEAAESNKAQANLTEEKRKKLAENEKNKGNEALRSNDLKEALEYYNKSLEYDPTMAATYCNRALINLKLKKYKEVIDDCDKAIQLTPDYVKAYHRRGKANMGRGEYLLALKDFQWIMSREPDNKEVNGDMLEARKHLDQVNKGKSQENAEAGGFRRIQIQEEEEGEDEENEQEKERAEGGEQSHEGSAKDQEFEKEQARLLVKIKKSLEPTDIKFEESKSRATEYIKKGQYPSALKDLQSSLDTLEKGYIPELRDQHELVLQEYLRKKAAILNNMALAYMQQEECKKVIEKTTEVISILEKVELEREVVIKAFMRRALAYEKLDKLKEAHYDFRVLRKLDPRNVKVSQFLDRVSKGLGKDAPRDDVPDPFARYLNTAGSLSKAQEKNKKETAENPRERNEVEQSKVQAEQNIPDSSKSGSSEIKDLKQIEQLKEEANGFFRNGKMQEAKGQFSKALDAIENNFYKEIGSKEKETITLYLQVLTNRALTLLNLKEFDTALIDCEKALKYEAKNLKALYRRALANIGKGDQYLSNGDFKVGDSKVLYLQKQLYESAQKDLEEVTSLDKKNDVAKQKMTDLVKTLVRLKLVIKDIEGKEAKNKEKSDKKDEKRGDSAQDSKPTAGVQEAESKAGSDDLKKKVAGNLTKGELNEVASNVMNNVLEELIKSSELPTSATNFEKNTMAFKKHSDKYFLYLKKIPIDHFVSLFQKVSIPTDCLIMITQALKEGGIREDKEFSLSLLESLPKTKSFDLEVMCLTKSERNSLMEELRKHVEDEQRLQKIGKILNIK